MQAQSIVEEPETNQQRRPDAGIRATAFFSLGVTFEDRATEKSIFIAQGAIERTVSRTPMLLSSFLSTVSQRAYNTASAGLPVGLPLLDSQYQ